jgi:calcineurin-like phosphoesterase family protein
MNIVSYGAGTNSTALLIEMINRGIPINNQSVLLRGINDNVETMSKLHGKKLLIKGNHDNFDLATYTPHFYDIAGALSIDRFMLTHIPIASHQKYRYRGNIHGHLHSEFLSDPWYQCVSVEQTGFKPVLFEEVKARYDN